MALTRTDKQFIVTLIAVPLLGVTATWMQHVSGREEAVTRILTVERIAPGHINLPVANSPAGKYWTTSNLHLRTKEHFRVRVSLAGKDVTFSAPIENAPVLKEGLWLSVTYKKNQRGEVTVYRFKPIAADQR